MVKLERGRKWQKFVDSMGEAYKKFPVVIHYLAQRAFAKQDEALMAEIEAYLNDGTVPAEAEQMVEDFTHAETEQVNIAKAGETPIWETREKKPKIHPQVKLLDAPQAVINRWVEGLKE